MNLTKVGAVLAKSDAPVSCTTGAWITAGTLLAVAALIVLAIVVRRYQKRANHPANWYLVIVVMVPTALIASGYVFLLLSHMGDPITLGLSPAESCRSIGQQNPMLVTLGNWLYAAGGYLGAKSALLWIRKENRINEWIFGVIAFIGLLLSLDSPYLSLILGINGALLLDLITAVLPWLWDHSHPRAPSQAAATAAPTPKQTVVRDAADAHKSRVIPLVALLGVLYVADRILKSRVDRETSDRRGR